METTVAVTPKGAGPSGAAWTDPGDDPVLGL